MSLPRPVYPGTTSMVTRRCTQRQYLLRPDAETNNAVVYCLAVAALRCKVDIILFTHMSNHLHESLYDRLGNAPAFYEHFHKLLAKCMNALRGRWENFFSSEQVCVVRLDTREDLVAKLVYIATNPVKAGLVAKVEDWPGAHGYRALLDGKPLRATRPKHFFSEDGTMPEEVTLEMTLPPELGDKDDILAEVKARVDEFEKNEAKRRATQKKPVLGRYAVLRQSWRDSPMSREPRRRLRPTFVARTFWALLERGQRKRDFAEAYRHARKDHLAGKDVVFPFGTYWLKRFVGVVVAGPKKIS